MNTKSALFLILFGAAGLYSCKDDSKDRPTPALAIPKAYDAANFSANTTAQKSITSQLKTLVDTLKLGRVQTRTLRESVLLSLYDGTNLKASTSAYYDSKIPSWLSEAAAASGKTYKPEAPTSGSMGGVLGGYLFNRYGLEIEQVVEKGLFGAALVRTAFNLLDTKPLTPQALDQALAILGGNPTFPNTSTAAPGRIPDAFFMVYLARRSDTSNLNSLYNQVKNNFIKAQAAAKAGPAYSADALAATSAIKLAIEKANAGTVINYCKSVIKTLSQTSPTDAQKGSALHALSEAIGFIHGWKTLSGKVITDKEIDEILALMNAPVGESPSCYLFVSEAFTNLPKLQQVIDKLKVVYSFSAAEIESFDKNWVNEQKR